MDVKASVPACISFFRQTPRPALVLLDVTDLDTEANGGAGGVRSAQEAPVLHQTLHDVHHFQHSSATLEPSACLCVHGGVCPAT